MKKDSLAYKIINKGEIYLGSFCFLVIMVLMTTQVITRYLFGHAFTWCEEISLILFVWMQYLGIAGAVLARKQLRIDFFLDMLPFKSKRVVLIIDNILTIVFCAWVIPWMFKIMGNMVKFPSYTPLLGIPNIVAYAILPISMALMIIRLIQDIFVLCKEDEKKLGATKPTLDLESLEKEYLAKKAEKEVSK